jgi:uncharacterized protein YecT (DUF1311 family)
MHPRIISISVFVLSATTVSATSPALGQDTAAAECASVQDQQSVNRCFAEHAQRSAALLDTLIAALRAHLDSAQYTELLKVESDWSTYRHDHCTWQARFFEGGSVQPTIYWTCLNDLTWARIRDLAINLCEGNGMTGSCTESERYERRSKPEGPN